MDDFELTRTIEARIASDADLARTFIDRPRSTIEPEVPLSGAVALEALRAMEASLDGKINVHETIGEGGMGVVHLATQATLGRHVAVKTLRAGKGDLGATLRILREAWVTGTLEHPNIVPVHDVGVDAAGSPVIVMKRIEGCSWAELMSSPELITDRFGNTDPLEWNVRTLASVCNAVHFAHSRGILHRDLKPENVMVGEFGEVYILDWGIAVSLLDDPSGRLPLAAHATELAGTPAYMAPEMFLGNPAAFSPQTDVYLLGAIFYEIFAGAPPHHGDTVQAMISSSLLSTIPFPSHFPAEAQRICSKAMSREPVDRYESAEAFRLAIDEYLRHRGSRKLARDAKRSLTHLLHTLEHEPPGEDRTLAVFNMLGECRFGYRSALAAWPENDAARKGLDRALLAVVEHELGEGHANSAATLLREVSLPPEEVVRRVEQALRRATEQEEHARRLQADLDPAIGTRTRTLIGMMLGTASSVVPVVGWIRVKSGHQPSHAVAMALSVAFLLATICLFFWARKTLSSTLLNRRIARSVGVQLCAQIVVTAGAWASGLSPHHGLLMLIVTWFMTITALAVWMDTRFGIPAIVCAASFLLAAVWPSALFPLMTFDNVVFTVVLVRVWFPIQELERLRDSQLARRQHARQWLIERSAARAHGHQGEED